ncbi:MAG: ABC transporter ATP-binding protein [Planctomycetota bacterium]|nr:ABC transporter ATP-binding protein [Planctomycetota bacterium]
MIEISDLEFQYGDAGFRLCIPRLSIGQGEKVAIVGPSGSGKTTLLMLLAGVQVASRGTIRVADSIVSSLSDADRRRFRIANIGFVFQEFELIEYLSAGENILLPYLINRYLKLDASVHEFAGDLAKSMGLSDKLARFPGRLSQGERQRVAICRAMITSPDVVLADEATGSLDPNTAKSMLDLLISRADARGATVLFVTHDHSLLDRFDRTIDLVDYHATATAAGDR